MVKYPKINSPWKRDKKGKFIQGQWSTPELEYLAENKWFLTEKIDGTNMQLYWTKGQQEFTVHGRTTKSDIWPNLQERMAKMGGSLYRELNLDLNKEVENFNEIIIYGEGYGPKIQEPRGSMYSDRRDFIVFDVKINGYFLSFPDVENFCETHVLQCVRRLSHAQTISYTAGLLKDIAKGYPSEIVEPFEGFVLRPMAEMYDKLGQRVITKLKVKDFVE